MAPREALAPGWQDRRPLRASRGRSPRYRRPRSCVIHNEFTAVFERDGDWHIAYCPEIPGANGQGRTKEAIRTGAYLDARWLQRSLASVLAESR